MADPRIIIVGAGPAGTRAAEVLVAAGLRPTVVDEGSRSGGQIYRRPPPNFTRSHDALYGTEAAKARAVHAAFDALGDRITYRPETLAWAIKDDRLHALKGSRSEALAYDALLLAPGATDRVMPLPGWTRPGCYSLGAAQIALKAQGCAIGERVVFLGTGPLLYLVAYQYMRAGHAPAAVLDTSSYGQQLSGLALMAARPGQLLKGVRLLRALRRGGVPVLRNVEPLEVLGDAHGVDGVRFRDADGSERRLACTAVGMGYHLRAESQLADLAGCEFRFDPAVQQWLPQTDAMGRSSRANVYLAGDGARLLGADAAETAGRLAACAMLADLGHRQDARTVARLQRAMKRHARFAEGVARAFPWPHALAAELPDATLVCRCEAITAGELRASVTALGAPEVNRAKAFSRVGMGRCQGRFCGLASQEIVAAACKGRVEAAGRLRGQAPVKPLPIALLGEDGRG
ncbi:FAD/NAD(P)-dependent oxidoreductase [Acuticoccus mangrovi]|uniref:FAD-dependent oxidoreductase n=1 Tax=Acuticoccus mangrovi TaxID=2796142 RepID=A0A934MFD2_9HYPH|nr:NAD(P)/FAD-dependent oxidoreductase [Acuticoccus mangrovi]MBJ3778542.1 FAD-dependent oxidoreductase [Acuticoccus mangrovi]